MRRHQTRITILSLVALLPMLAAAACNDDETEPTITIPTASATAEPLALEVQDAGHDADAAPSASASVKKRTGPPGDPTGIAKCCSALHQNAKLGGPNAGNYDLAAKACDGLRRDARTRAGLVQVRRLLLNAKVPAQCK